MDTELLSRTTSLVAEFYDGCKLGCEGVEGFRKSTDLARFIGCIHELLAHGIIDPERTVFADLGCADGRVNVLMSYFVKLSIGIEIDPEILAEYLPRKRQLTKLLAGGQLITPPDNIALFKGSSLEESTFRVIRSETGVGFSDIDLFYTYITLHDLFAEKITREARRGALYLVYGFGKVLPRYDGLDLLIPDVASQGIAALYTKKTER